jgi:hypothetical protein
MAANVSGTLRLFFLNAEEEQLTLQVRTIAVATVRFIFLTCDDDDNNDAVGRLLSPEETLRKRSRVYQSQEKFCIW